MKKSSGVLIATPIFIVLMIIAVLVPYVSWAAADTLGTESPVITAQFKDSNGKTVDGNELSAGTYNVNIVLSGMQAFSIFEMTADYDTDIISDLSITSTLSDSKADEVVDMGGSASDGRIVIGMISANYVEDMGGTTSIDSNGTIMASLSVTITSACDFADVFTLITNPRLTFVESDYQDGYNDCYVLDLDYNVDYEIYLMTQDMSPVLANDTYTVTGSINIATSVDGTAGSVGIVGQTVTLTNLDGEEYSAVTADTGIYEITGVPAGDYTMVISGSTTVTRDNISLTVSSDKAVDGVISVETIGAVVCDYSGDGYITSTDRGLFLATLNKPENFKIYMDLSGDGYVTSTDRGLFYSFLNKTIEYTAITV
jgi:hypothetical protein